MAAATTTSIPTLQNAASGNFNQGRAMQQHHFWLWSEEDQTVSLPADFGSLH